LSLCDIYIGNDSGFSHLAGLLGRRAVVLFGPTDPLVWKPLGPRVETLTTIDRGELTGLTVEAVLARSEALLSIAMSSAPRTFPISSPLEIC
jgi:heptosyltransferase III